jgi:hypothetical protein
VRRAGHVARATNFAPNVTESAYSDLILIACSIVLRAAAPKGWFVAGNRASAYESGVDALAAFNGHLSAFLKSNQPVVQGFGTLMQDFRADHHLGKRVRFSAF